MTTIKLKNGSGAPTAGDLVQGEPALDLTNKRLYTENASGTVIEVGTNPGTDVTFTDNRKAIFGAGSDLQIYHDGTHSVIDDTGTGNLILQSNGAQISLQSSTEYYLTAANNGAVTLYNNNSAKLATTSTGIDVTGTVTADSLDVNGTATVDGITAGTAADFTFTGPLNNDLIINTRPNTAGEGLLIQYNGTLGAAFINGGDAVFYNSAGTSQDFYWDASTSQLGLGRTNPQRALHVDIGTNNEGVRVTSSNTFALYEAEDSGGTVVFGSADGDFKVKTGGNFNFTVDSSGNVGIGTTSPSTLLHVKTTGSDARIYSEASSGTMYIGQSTFSDVWSTANTSMRFATNNTERMRIGSGGDVWIGKTSSGIGTVGHEFGPTGYTYHTRDGGTVLDLNRKTSDGKIAKFYKDGAEVGSISVTASATAYNTSSDQRLKDNIVDAPSASDDIDAIQVRSFDWKADGSHQKYGMVAQELQTVAPDAVTEGDTEEDMMSVDYSKLVPMLVKEIQSLRARVAQLEGAN